MSEAYEKLRRRLLSGQARIGVWGTGYIGFSTMVYFASSGVSTVGTDVSESIVNTINQGKIPVPNMEYWLGFEIRPLVDSEMMKATLNWKEIIREDVPVHTISVPTEKGERPWDGALEDVIEKLANFRDVDYNDPPLIIIESTLTPNKTDQLVIPILESAGLTVGKDILVGVAPRRDWFISPEKNLKSLPRIIGGTTPETTKLMQEVLGIVCDHLVPAPDHRHAEMVKSIENAYRHVEIMLANQLSLAYPNINMVEVLRLVGTKWNIGTFHPSFGSGGYCIPVSSHYVLQGAQHPAELTLLKAAIATDERLPILVADSITTRGAKRIGILGLAYKGDLKVHILSPTLRMVRRFKEGGVEVKVNDPYYSPDEIMAIVGTEAFHIPEGLAEFDALVIVAGHRLYRAMSASKLLPYLKKCKLIVDNVEETWKHMDFRSHGIEYHVAGDSGWLST